MRIVYENRCDDKFDWKYGNIIQLPHESGIYIFWDECVGKARSKSSIGRCIYVGQSKNLKARLRQHFNGSHNKYLSLWIKNYGNRLKVHIAYRAKEKLDRLEKRLIRVLNPKVNVIHNK